MPEFRIDFALPQSMAPRDYCSRHCQTPDERKIVENRRQLKEHSGTFASPTLRQSSASLSTQSSPPDPVDICQDGKFRKT